MLTAADVIKTWKKEVWSLEEMKIRSASSSGNPENRDKKERPLMNVTLGVLIIILQIYFYL